MSSVLFWLGRSLYCLTLDLFVGVRSIVLIVSALHQEGVPILKNSGLKKKKIRVTRLRKSVVSRFVWWPRIGCSACFAVFLFVFLVVVFVEFLEIII